MRPKPASWASTVAVTRRFEPLESSSKGGKIRWLGEKQTASGCQADSIDSLIARVVQAIVTSFDRRILGGLGEFVVQLVEELWSDVSRSCLSPPTYTTACHAVRQPSKPKLHQAGRSLA